jgi:hypothetical protein
MRHKCTRILRTNGEFVPVLVGELQTAVMGTDDVIHIFVRPMFTPDCLQGTSTSLPAKPDPRYNLRSVSFYLQDSN